MNELDALIADELVFIDHTGRVVDKATDLDAHRSGVIRIDELEVSDQLIKIYGETAVVSVQLRIKGLFFGQPSEGVFRFMRIWADAGKGLQVVMGQSTMMSGN